MYFPTAVTTAAVGPALSVAPSVLAPPTAVAAPAAAPAATAPDALDRWRTILDTFTAIRPSLVTSDGLIVPETTVGDVQRAALRFSRMLCAPCYDGANLADTRAAWRDALARMQAQVRGAPWAAVYPDNPGWWLSDTRALAQHLAEVDRRRNAIAQAPSGTITILGGRHDPLLTYLDLRAYFLARRLARSANGWRYPETTVRDVLEIVRIVNEDVAAVVAKLPPGATADWLLDGRIAAWEQVARRVVATARGLPADEPHPENRRMWVEYRRVSIPLSVAAGAAPRAGLL